MIPIPPPKYPPYTATNNSKIDAPVTAATLESCEIPAGNPTRPNAGQKQSQQRCATRQLRQYFQEDVCVGVLISKMAPTNPPITLVRISGIITLREMFNRMRYAPPLAVVPTQSASVLVALAGTAGTPVNKSAGKATKLPPPATALIAPPSAPAKNRKIAVCKFKQIFYHDSRPRSTGERNPAGTARHHVAAPPIPEASPRPTGPSPFLTSRLAPYMYGQFLDALPHRRPDSNSPTRVTGGIPDERVSASSCGVFTIRIFV